MNTMENEFEKRGISIILLKAIRELALDRNNDKEFWSIGALSAYLVGNHEILKMNCRWKDVNVDETITFNDKCSIIDMLKHHHMDEPHPILNVTYNEVVNDKANVFISFAYSSNFIELVDAVENYLYLSNQDDTKTFFWFDVVINNQWLASSKSFEWWATTFREAVEQIGETLLILTPWNEPHMLSRAWCLYEISCSKKISIGMSKDQNKSFLESLRTSSQIVLQSIFKIDLENASAYDLTDKEKIFDVVRNMEGGFHKFNTEVSQLLHDWISNEVRKIAFKFDNMKFLTMEEIYDLSKAGIVLNNQGKLDEAYDIFTKCLHTLESNYDLNQKNSEHFLQYTMTLNNLGINCRRRNHLKESEAFFKLALKEKVAIFGHNHEDVLECMGNYGNCLRDLQKLGDAKLIFQEITSSFEKLCGLNNHKTLRAMDNLANIISDQGNFIDAQVIYETVLKGYEVIGIENAGYMDTLNNIAINLFNLERVPEALLFYEKAYLVSSKQLGFEHSDTLRSMQNFAMSLVRIGRVSESLPILRKLATVLKKVGDPQYSLIQSLCDAIGQRNSDNVQESSSSRDHSDNLGTNCDKLQFAISLKERGSLHYSQLCKLSKNNPNAFSPPLVLESLRYYNLALKSLSDLDNNDVIDMKRSFDLKLVLYLNIAQCYLKLQDWDKVQENCNYVLEIDSSNVKALYRRGCCFEAQKKFDLALVDFQHAKKNSSDPSIITAIERVKREIVAKPLLNPEEHEELLLKFCEARGLDQNNTAILMEQSRKNFENSDVESLNQSAKFLAEVIGIDIITLNKAPNEMTVKELKGAIFRAGLESKTAYLTEKSDYIALLNEYLEQQFPVDSKSEDDLIQNLIMQVVNQGKKLEKEGQFQLARAEIEKALDMMESSFGLDDSQTVECSLLYSNILFKLGLVQESSQICNNILERISNVLGSSHQYTKQCKEYLERCQLNNQSIALQHFDIEKLQQCSQIIFQFDPDSNRREEVMDFANTIIKNNKMNPLKLNQIGNIMNKFLDKTARFPSYASGIKVSLVFRPIDPNTFSEEIRKYSNSLKEIDEDVSIAQDERISIGKLLEEKGELEKARCLFEEVLTDHEEKYGTDDPRTDECAINFARVNYKLCNYGEAKHMYNRTMELRTSLGASHPTIIECLKGLEICQNAINTIDEDQSMIQLISSLSITQLMNLINILNLKALATSLREKTEFVNLIFDKIKETGGTCSHFEDFLFDCAIKYKSVGNCRTARDLYEKLYIYQIDKHGIDNKSTLLTANNLSSTIMDIGIEEQNYDLKKHSTELREQTLKYMENVFGINGNETLACAYNLAQNYISIDDLEGSCKMYKKSLLGRDITLGKEHEQTLDTVANLARVISRLASEKLSSCDVSVLQDGLNMADESLLLFKRALDGKSKVIGINHPSTQNCKDSMEAASSIRMHFISKLGISHDDTQYQIPQELQEEEQDRYTIAQLREWAGIIKALNPNEIEGKAEYDAAMELIHNNANNPQLLDQIGRALLEIINST